jgi:hypothetical protein
MQLKQTAERPCWWGEGGSSTCIERHSGQQATATAAAAAAAAAAGCLCRNGSTQWLLRNASAVRVPGTNHTYQDVGIIQNKMDIKAGNAIVHIIDLP